MEIIYSKGNVVVREAVFHDIEAMSGRLRPEDLAEVKAVGHETAAEALETGFNLSDLCLTVLYKNEVAAMFGVVNDFNQVGDAARVWMLGTDTVSKFPKTFAQLSVLFIKTLLKQYPVMYNYVDLRHMRAVEWLAWCGAEFGEKVEWGQDRVPFQKFYLRRN